MNTTTIKRLFAALATATALCIAPTASADPGVLKPTGYPAGSENFTTNFGSFGAGGFAGTWDGQDIRFWCIELTQPFSFGSTYDYMAVPEKTPVVTALGQLFTLAYGSALSSSEYSAAFQLAIWELVYDTDHSLLSGAFNVTGGSENARAIAEKWLSLLGPESPDIFNLTLLISASNQDFVTFGKPFSLTQVPEPAPLALLALAMLAMIVVRRRREHHSRT